MNKKGFTLIELIIVIAIIALLAAATFVAVDPVKRIGDANDAQRWADVTAIADAIIMYTADNSGNLPTDVAALTNGAAAAVHPDGTTETTCPDEQGSGAYDNDPAYDLADLTTGGYIAAVPTDPNDGTTGFTYYIAKESTGAILVGACDDYSDSTIYVWR